MRQYYFPIMLTCRYLLAMPLCVQCQSGQPKKQLSTAGQVGRNEHWCMCVYEIPHLQEVIKKLPSHLKIVDLSADFRLKDPAQYAEW